MNRAHALVVDDEIHSRELLSELLQAMRFEVTEADSGSEALERIRKSRYDIVITDWVMPGMDGLSLIKQAKALDADVPFLMVTGYPSVNGAVAVMKQGASDYLSKPFSPQEFAGRVGRIVRQKSAANKLAPVKAVIIGTLFSLPAWALILWAISSLFD